MPSAHPFIVTIAIDKPSHDKFTALRNRYYPAWCNHLEAHIILLHRLMGTEEEIRDSVEKFSVHPAFPLLVTGVEQQRNAVCYTIRSEALEALARAMRSFFNPVLTAKDRHLFRPHITVQNKVTVYKAMTTATELCSDFTRFSMEAIGLSLWKFNRGPWVHVQDFPFGTGKG